ncbi:MAG: class I SAM-dependent methyltransferase [Saprospiraceae bacterium]|nr:class I SAM-dependent methyltransferase [Saprospiraceae bacterium]
MKFTFYTLIFCFTLWSCNNQEKHSYHHDHSHDNESNVHMNETSFEDLVKMFEDSARAEWQKPDEIIDLLGDLDGKTIMDIGAGTGYFAFRMAAKGANVIAADVDERFIEYIDNKDVAKVKTRLVPYDNSNLKPKEVDAVIIVDTYHHIEKRADYFKTVLKGLKENGQLMVVDFKKEETPYGPPVNHRISADDVVKELKSAGFTSFEIEEDFCRINM